MHTSQTANEPAAPVLATNLRLTLICHAATVATRQAAFPLNEVLEPRGLAAARALAGRFASTSRVPCSPALRARQTAAALGFDPQPELALADLDAGRWAGRRVDDLAAAEPVAFAGWMRDPGCAPHGGETLAALCDRVATWMANLAAAERRVVAVTHAAVIRAAVLAALGAPATGFWRIDVAPLFVARLQRGGTGWTLRTLAPAAELPPDPA